MPYESRFGCCAKYNRIKHDPATYGIFIHGGVCTSGPFYNSYTRNKFSLTVPCNNKQDAPIDLAKMYGVELARNFPTFQKCLEYALRIRAEMPVLRCCAIFACTDMLMDTTYSGKTGVQLLSWPDNYDRELRLGNHLAKGIKKHLLGGLERKAA